MGVERSLLAFRVRRVFSIRFAHSKRQEGKKTRRSKRRKGNPESFLHFGRKYKREGGEKKNGPPPTRGKEEKDGGKKKDRGRKILLYLSPLPKISQRLWKTRLRASERALGATAIVSIECPVFPAESVERARR